MTEDLGEKLFGAVYRGDEDAVVRLLRAGAPAGAEDASGSSALHEAAVNGHAGVVRLLLAWGADPGHGAELPLCGAASAGRTDAVRALLAAGADPDQEEEFGFTALAWAVGQGHTGTVRALLEYGADPGRPGADGGLPLVAAARRGSPSVVRALLAHRAPGRKEALREARRWMDADVAGALRDSLAEAYGDDCETVTRRVAEDGGVTVVVELLRDGVPSAGAERQTGHPAIVTLLEAELGVRTPPEELAGRALGCGDPAHDTWTESVRALRARGDRETLRAAAEWRADGDPLRRALAADVLAGPDPAADRRAPGGGDGGGRGPGAAGGAGAVG
ncbi:ankyrin repeat domain-containing protein [Streptomyces sp. NPDC050856]|uniref:ankyrin repeat domain-containing protein n=1 Tax=Streptomyces sp. NPDC050856 TaxID=3154939 RepID=UPI0033FC034C